MKKILLLVILILPMNLLAKDNVNVQAQESLIKSVKSPVHRVALLELYTSEGCSSCPPADRFLSNLKTSGISDNQLIPMAFHVTYWDYIGWKDRFAKKQYDQRQRDMARKKNKNTIYTPQFVLVGSDYRRYATFSTDIKKLTAETSDVDLELSTQQKGETLHLKLQSNVSRSKVKNVGFYFVVVENNLSSHVSDGENEGEVLRHDYVVRQLSGPYFQNKSENGLVKKHIITIRKEWKKHDLSIVAFAENSHTGEVLQAVRVAY